MQLCGSLNILGFPHSSVDKESACSAGDPGSIPGLGISAGEGIGYPLHYSWASFVAQLVKNPPAMRETWFDPWVGKIPWRRERLPTPVFWPGEFQGLYSPWGHKESDTIERLSLSLEHSLALPFFGIGKKTDLFQSCGHCWVFQICWHIECSTLTHLQRCVNSKEYSAKKIINLISVLTIWWCSYVESSLVLLNESVCYDQYILLAKLCQPLTCFVLYSKAIFACYSRYPLTSYFCIPVPYNEKDIFFGC